MVEIGAVVLKMRKDYDIQIKGDLYIFTHGKTVSLWQLYVIL